MKSHWFRLFAIVGIGLCGATADAANLKIYPGAVCQQSSNDDQEGRKKAANFHGSPYRKANLKPWYLPKGVKASTPSTY